VKRPRHPNRYRGRKFLQSPEPVGVEDKFPDLLCDLPDDIRRELPNTALRAKWSNTKGGEF
jgi:hypothetical protein